MSRLVLPFLMLGAVCCSEEPVSEELAAAFATGEELADCLAAQQGKLEKPTSAQVRQMMTNCAPQLEAHSARIVEGQLDKPFDPKDAEMRDALNVNSEALSEFLVGEIEQGKKIEYD